MNIRVTKKHDRTALAEELAADAALTKRTRSGRVALFTIVADGDASVVELHDDDAKVELAVQRVVREHKGKPLEAEPDPREVAAAHARELIRAVPDKATRDALRAVLDLRSA
jgi:hypothetical protein